MEKSEILEPLYEIANELARNALNGKSHLIEYTNDDIMIAYFLFIEILGNRLIHNHTRQNLPIQKTKDDIEKYKNDIMLIVKSISGIDAEKYYQIRKGNINGTTN